MRFKVSDEAIGRLHQPELKDREFDGPAVERGILLGFTNGERRWARKEVLRVEQSETISFEDEYLLYFFLAIRRSDPTLLPPKRWADIAGTDFEVIPHAYVGELAGCRACGEPVRSTVHDVPEDL